MKNSLIKAALILGSAAIISVLSMSASAYYIRYGYHGYGHPGFYRAYHGYYPGFYPRYYYRGYYGNRFYYNRPIVYRSYWYGPTYYSTYRSCKWVGAHWWRGVWIPAQRVCYR